MLLLLLTNPDRPPHLCAFLGKPAVSVSPTDDPHIIRAGLGKEKWVPFERFTIENHVRLWQLLHGGGCPVEISPAFSPHPATAYTKPATSCPGTIGTWIRGYYG